MSAVADLFAATRAYERWLKAKLAAVPRDLALKHSAMAGNPFAFMRASFYRWVPLWHELCPELASAPRLLAVGDLHIENFGTWRDAEARLVWGLNDVDEAAVMPYTIDLVRLAASALLARRGGQLGLAPKLACKAILRGYRGHLEAGGHAFVLEETHPNLRAAALSAERDPVRFWQKLEVRPSVNAPLKVRRLLSGEMPQRRLPFRTIHRVSGLGSLGRPRYVALAEWQGGNLAREAKAMLPSAYGWALGRTETKLYGETILARAVRCRDPFFAFRDGWQIRRLAPHCARIELAMLPRERDEERLIEAMGRETANIHLGTPGAAMAVRADLARRPKGWLLAAADIMARAIVADWQRWRERHG